MATEAATPQPQSGRSGAVAPPRSGQASEGDDDYDWFGLAAALACFSGLPESLLAQHRPGRTGHCVTCRHQANGVAAVYPCKLRPVAELAIKVRRGR